MSDFWVTRALMVQLFWYGLRPSIGNTDLPLLPDGAVRAWAAEVEGAGEATNEGATCPVVGAGASWAGGAVGEPIFSSSRETTWRPRIMINLYRLVKWNEKDITNSCSPFVLNEVASQPVDDNDRILAYLPGCYEVVELSG